MKGVQISTRCPSWQMVFLIISIFTVIIVPAVIVLHKKSTKHEMESSWMVNNATRAIKLPDSLRNASGNDNDIHAMKNSTNPVVCKVPFKKSSDPQFESCVPPCPPGDTVIEKSYVNAFKAMAYICITLEFVCSCIIIFTYVLSVELRRFPHIITLFMALLNCLRVVVVSIPYIAGQSRTMCPGDTIISSILLGGTTFCEIQGGIIHFTAISTFSWFCFSVCNITVALLTFSTDSIIKRHPKALFLLEICLATIVPGIIVAIVFSTSSYKPDILFMYVCLPNGINALFYSCILPVQISCVVVMVMSITIMRRLRQSNSLRRRVNCEGEGLSRSVAQIALKRRFLVLAVVMPLLYLFLFTLLGTYFNYNAKEIIEDGFGFSHCLLNEEHNGKKCRSSRVAIINFSLHMCVPIYTFLFSILLVLYSFIPKPAREVWKKLFRKTERVV